MDNVADVLVMMLVVLALFPMYGLVRHLIDRLKE